MGQDKGCILIALPADRVLPETAAALKKIGEGRELFITSKKADVEKVLDKIEIGIGDVPFSLIAGMPRLKWVQIWSAGADQLQRYPALKEAPFILTSTSGIHGQQISEHLFGMIFAWNRHFPAAFAAQARHTWLKIQNRDLPTLAGKTMLILGYGAIGETAARAALAFGMRVIGLRRHIPPAGSAEPVGIPAEAIRVEPIAKLNGFLPQADLVVNILPLTQDTMHAFGKDEFALMKQSALYANIGRGATTDETALIEALKSKTIAGALLDVTEKEPLPEDSPLWDMHNVILTGHYAGLRTDYDALAFEITLDNLARYVQGTPLRNVIDKTTGY